MLTRRAYYIPCKFMRLAIFQMAHKSTDISKLCLLLIAILFINITSVSKPDSAVSPLIQKKTQLSQSLDSLNLLKQNKKREGKSFSDIEIKENKILDSLQLIRQTIQTNISSSDQDPKIKEKQFSLFKPPNFSDLLMLLTAIIVLFFGILLLLGKAKKILYPNIKNSNQQKAVQTILNSEDTSSLENICETPASDNQKNLPQMPDPQIQSLEKKQITEELSSVDHNNDSKEELEAKVIKAASDGMNIQEISRLFHLSSDHVSLILRLSESLPKK